MGRREGTLFDTDWVYRMINWIDLRLSPQQERPCCLWQRVSSISAGFHDPE